MLKGNLVFKYGRKVDVEVSVLASKEKTEEKQW